MGNKLEKSAAADAVEQLSEPDRPSQIDQSVIDRKEMDHDLDLEKMTLDEQAAATDAIEQLSDPPEQPCQINRSDIDRKEMEHDLDLEKMTLDEQPATVKRDEETTLQEAKVKSQSDDRKPRDDDALDQLRESTYAKVGLDIANCNVGVVGRSGVGISTLINCLRSLKPGDPEAARVDGNQCTAEMTKYPHPTAMRLMLWDCPGSDTLDHPSESYFKDQHLFAFDFLLVVTDSFGQGEIDLIKEAITHKMPFAIVRNKVNRDFDKKRQDNKEFGDLPKEQAVAEFIQELRSDTKERLEKAGITTEPPIFLINAEAMVDKDKVAFEERQLIEFVAREISSRLHGGQ